MIMSAKAKRSGTTEARQVSSQTEATTSSVAYSSPDEEIRRRAYHIYLERGEQPGRELDDWLDAEREARVFWHV